MAVVAGAAPIAGDYASGTLGGGVLDGRLSVTPDPLNPANSPQVNAQSWDGTALGTEWILTTGGGVVGTPTSLGGGLWQVDVDYSDPVLTLASGGPWTGTGDGDYTVSLSSLVQNMLFWVDGGGNVTNTSSSLAFEGTFDGFGSFDLVDGTASGILTDFGASGDIPGDYPDALVSGQGAAWGVMNNIQFEIAPEPATLALLGLGAAATFITRRRRR